MNPFGKSIWSQGMFLRPQHFQNHERYWEEQLHRRVMGADGYAWGIERLQINESALSLGRFEVSAVSAVFHDGTILHATQGNELPTSRIFGAEASGRRIMLAIPIRQPGMPDVMSDDRPGISRRYRRTALNLRDTSAEDDEFTEIHVGRLAPALLLDDAELDAWETMPIARIEHASESEIRLDARFLPPVLNCAVHSGYRRILEELHAVLLRKMRFLGKELDPSSFLNPTDMMDFHLLQLVSRYEASFSHILGLNHVSPERAFALATELAGELNAFAPDLMPNRLPYDHANPSPGWAELLRFITRTLGRASEHKAVEVPLEQQFGGFHVAVFTDRSLIDAGAFVLVVRPGGRMAGGVSHESVRIDDRLKIGTVDRLREIVKLQLPGIPCRPLPVIPKGVPYFPDATYLEIDQGVPAWREVRDSASLAAYFVGRGEGYRLQLWVLHGGDAVQPEGCDILQEASDYRPGTPGTAPNGNVTPVPYRGGDQLHRAAPDPEATSFNDLDPPPVQRAGERNLYVDSFKWEPRK